MGLLEVFILFPISVRLSNIMAISALNQVHSMYRFKFTFISEAVLFILLEADFIALIFIRMYFVQ